MQVVWAESPIEASDVVRRLANTDWRTLTNKTMLGRLVNQGALSYSVSGNRFLYRPHVSHEKYLKKVSQSFLNKLFGGDPGSHVTHSVANTNLSVENLEETRRVLANKELEARS